MQKKVLLVLLLCIPCIIRAQTFAEDKLVSLAIIEFDGLKDMQSCIAASNQWKKIANTYPNEWIPLYYRALVQIKMSMYRNKDTELFADAAIENIMLAKNIQANDEVLCVESLAYSNKMAIHPSWRWMLYEQKITKPLVLAKKINMRNPRIYVMEAMMQFKLPSLIGGGCKTALPLAKKAASLLIAQEKNNVFRPHWGANSIQEVMNGCAF